MKAVVLSPTGGKQFVDGELFGPFVADITALALYSGIISRMATRYGDFYTHDPSSTATPIGYFVVAATGKGAGRWLLQVRDKPVNPYMFGAVGNGIADDTTALQSALTYCASTGCLLSLPSGVFNYNTPLIADLANATGTLEAKGKRMSIVGQGSSNTCLRYVGSNTAPSLTIKGTLDDNLTLKGFRIGPANTTAKVGTGLRIEKLARFDMTDLSVKYFDLNIELAGVNEGVMTKVVSEWANRGIYASNGGFGIEANAILFNSCHINSNLTYGAFIENGCSNTFQSCVMLGNGTMGNLDTGAIKVRYVGTNGRVAFNVENCYIEGNAGRDISVTFTKGGSFNIRGTGFNRLNNTKCSTNHIYFKAQDLLFGSTEVCNITMHGNSAFSDTPYTPSSSRPTVVLEGGDNAFNNYVVDDVNYYQNDVEKPTYTSLTRPRYRDYSPVYALNPDTIGRWGTYCIPSAASRTGGTMPPAQGLDFWTLESIVLFGENGRESPWRRQVASEILTGAIYERNYRDDTGQWSAWYRVHTNRSMPVKEGVTYAQADMWVYNTATSQFEPQSAYAVRYNNQTGTAYTLTEADNGKLIVMTNAAAITLTLAPGLSTGFNCIIEQGGAGVISWANGSGVTNNVYPASSTKTAGQRARVAVEHRGSNVYYLNGQITT